MQPAMAYCSMHVHKNVELYILHLLKSATLRCVVAQKKLLCMSAIADSSSAVEIIGDWPYRCAVAILHAAA